MPPDFDREYDTRPSRIRQVKWTPGMHRKCGVPQKRAIHNLILHCTCRCGGIATLPLEIVIDRILTKVPVTVYL